LCQKSYINYCNSKSCTNCSEIETKIPISDFSYRVSTSRHQHEARIIFFPSLFNTVDELFRINLFIYYSRSGNNYFGRIITSTEEKNSARHLLQHPKGTFNSCAIRSWKIQSNLIFVRYSHIYLHQSILYMHYHILEHYNCVVSANSGLGKLHCPSIRHCRIDRRSFR
jgi:hypothetical protein